MRIIGKTYIPVDDKMIPRRASLISSHVTYKIKIEEDRRRRLKSKIFPHGNRDQMKDDIKKNSVTAEFYVIRLILAIVTFLSLRRSIIDIRGDYMKNGP